MCTVPFCKNRPGHKPTMHPLLEQLARELDGHVVRHNDHIMVGDVRIEIIETDPPCYGVSGYIGAVGGAETLDTPQQVKEWLTGAPLVRVLDMVVRAVEETANNRPPAGQTKRS